VKAPSRSASNLAPLLASVLIAVTFPVVSHAQATLPTGFTDQLVVGGFSAPVGMAFLPGGRLIVIEQVTGRVRLIVNGQIVSPEIGTVPSVNTSGGERGLLGIAVDPAWPARPYLYTHNTHASSPPRIRISRFTVTGDLAGTGNQLLAFDPATRYDLLNNIPDDANNHNGGTLRFGPDNMLYVSVGEDATPCAAQDTSTMRGVILRLDVSRLPAGAGGPADPSLITPADNPFTSGTGYHRLIWAYGLRNPFRFHIDPATRALLIADVGQNVWEEVDFAPQGGMNFGWPILEGNAPFSSSCPAVGPLTGPILVFDHNEGNAVISGGVYRRPAGAPNGYPPVYEGDYFCSDYYSGSMWRLRNSGGTWSLAAPVAGQPTSRYWATGLNAVPDYLVGPDGAVWYCKQSTGQIRRIVSDSIDNIRPAVTVLE
jgi:glucose/arabinose dehydrogenase